MAARAEPGAISGDVHTGSLPDDATGGAALADDELRLVRTFDAPLALVWRLWDDPAHLIRWWGPKDFTCTHIDLPLRPGARWRACIVSPSGNELWMGGEMREIEVERRIVMTFAWDDEAGRPGAETLVTITFAESDGRTVQSFHQAPFATIEERDSHASGWSEFLDRERDYIESLGSDAA